MVTLFPPTCTSQKYSLYADRAGQLQQRGVARKEAMMLIAASGAIALDGEWLEAFWCDQCNSWSLD